MFTIETRKSGSIGCGYYWQASLWLLYYCWEIQISLQMLIISGGETFLSSCLLISLGVQLRLVYRQLWLLYYCWEIQISLQMLVISGGEIFLSSCLFISLGVQLRLLYRQLFLCSLLRVFFSSRLQINIKFIIFGFVGLHFEL